MGDELHLRYLRLERVTSRRNRHPKSLCRRQQAFQFSNGHHSPSNHRTTYQETTTKFRTGSHRQNRNNVPFMVDPKRTSQITHRRKKSTPLTTQKQTQDPTHVRTRRPGHGPKASTIKGIRRNSSKVSPQNAGTIQSHQQAIQRLLPTPKDTRNSHYDKKERISTDKRTGIPNDKNTNHTHHPQTNRHTRHTISEHAQHLGPQPAGTATRPRRLRQIRPSSHEPPARIRQNSRPLGRRRATHRRFSRRERSRRRHTDAPRNNRSHEASRAKTYQRRSNEKS